MTAKQLELRVHNVKCIDDIGGSRVTEWRSDDIYLGGTAVVLKYPIPSVVQVPYFKVGQFDDRSLCKVQLRRNRKTCDSPKTFDLRKSSSFPKNYAISLVLVERDSGDQLNSSTRWLKNNKKQSSKLIG